MATLKILIADDDQDDFELIASMLSDLDTYYQLTYAANGAELLDRLETCAKLQDGMPDLILLDINMPKVDGIQALKKIREKKYLSVPIVIYSTAAGSEQISQCFSLGANGFVTKSATLEGVSEFVKQVDAFLHSRSPAPGSSNLILNPKT